MQSDRPGTAMVSEYWRSSVIFRTDRVPPLENGRFSIQMYSPSRAMRWNDDVALLAASA